MFVNPVIAVALISIIGTTELPVEVSPGTTTDDLPRHTGTISMEVLDSTLVNGTPRIQRAMLHFRWDKTNYEDSYLDNSDAATMLMNILQEAGPENIDSVSVVAYASPEGVYEHNKMLSRRRAKEFERVFEEQYGGIDIPVNVRPGGEAWELLRERLNADKNLSKVAHDRIFAILDNPNLRRDTMKWLFTYGKLGATRQEGDVYHYMLINHYRYLRCLDITIHYKHQPESGTPPSDTTQEIEPADTVAVVPRDTTSVIPSAVEESLPSASNGLLIYYPTNKADYHPEYLDNSENLDAFRGFVQRAERIDSLVVYGYASPEGVYGYNLVLSRQRAENFASLIRSEFGDLVGDAKIIVRPLGENWEGLKLAVSQYYDREDREEVLEILNSGLSSAEIKSRLKKLDNGQSYGYIVNHLMSRLRSASCACAYVPKDLLVASREMEGSVVEYKPEPIQKTEKAPLYDKKTVVALKTNLLYDVPLMFNFAVEVPFNLGNEQFSVEYEHYFPWWVLRNNRTCIQYLSTGPEFRWWFHPEPIQETAKKVRRDALVGHFVGAHAKYIKTDLQWNTEGCYQCYIKTAGITYGYSAPVFKRANLEFSLSVGYANIQYQHYVPTDDWQILLRDRTKAGTLHYFGPTELDITLSIPILTKYRKW